MDQTTVGNVKGTEVTNDPALPLAWEHFRIFQPLFWFSGLRHVAFPLTAHIVHISIRSKQLFLVKKQEAGDSFPPAQ